VRFSLYWSDKTTIALQKYASTLSMHRFNTSHDDARAPTLSIWPATFFGQHWFS
jgi:hypothetical protein